MSLGCFAELLSVTNDAVKSLSKSSSIGASENIMLLNAGSPFESPPSFKSASDKIESNYKRGIENATPGEFMNPTNDAQLAENNTHLAGRDGEDKMTVDIMSSRIDNIASNNYTPEVLSSDNFMENINNSCSSQKVSISKKHLREIISPREADHISLQSHSAAFIKKSRMKEGNFAPTVSISREKIFVEYHEPNNVNKNNNNRIFSGENRKESMDSTRSFGDQSEIIEVHAKDTAITSGITQSSDEFVRGMHNKDEDYHVSAGSKTGHHDEILSGKSHQSHGLKQGALNKGFVDPTKTDLFNDVYIAQFGLTEKQRGLKEALAKRSKNKKPKKMFVQPHIVHRKVVDDDGTERAVTNNQTCTQAVTPAVDPMITAAAAASAAVAAAQPFLKHELETRIQQLLTQLAGLQQKASGADLEDKSAGSDNRIQDLERQVAELSERRFEHLENLQQQQMQMQAQLLFMSQARSSNIHEYLTNKKISPTRQLQNSRIPQVRNRPGISSQSQPTYNHNIHNYPAYKSTTHSQPTFNPVTLSKHHNYLNEVRELQGSHLDTPAPRDRVPKPIPYTLPKEPQKNLGFLEELLARNDNIDKDTTYNVKGDYSSSNIIDSDRNNSARGWRHDQSPVDKARQLVTSLSSLEKDTYNSLWSSRDGANKRVKVDVDLGPAPLDRYLKYPEKEGSPYPKLNHHSKVAKKMLDNVDNLMEAKNILRHLEETRETLEKNIDQVVRSRRDMNIFSAMLGSGTDSAADEKLRIEKLVTKKITALEGDVQREVLRSLAQSEADKLAAQQKLELAAKKNFGHTRIGPFMGGQTEQSARLAYKKSSVLATAALPIKGKENRERTIKPPPKTVAIRDEATRVRTYGKPEYQRGRTTIRDPYLHFKNSKKGVAAKSSVTNLNESARSRDGRSKSPPGKQGQEPVIDHMPRQFYFSPTRGYIPLSAGDTVPIQGQLVSMAIPLGAPRLERGLRRSAVPVTKSTYNPVSSTPVTADRNVAMVSFPIEEDKKGEYERQPELTKQVLPPLDIDSISPSSSRRSDILIRSPQHDNANVTFLYDTHNEEVSDLNKTLTEESSDLEQLGEGINLPGYEPKTTEYAGTSFPPRISKRSADWMVSGEQVNPAQHLSNVMAEDLRRRDMLENNAVMWLEQELMARILAQVPLQGPEQVANTSTGESEEGSDWNESLLVADAIGQSGMQLFIDAGQPVDNALVQELVKEVIKEKVMTLMSQRKMEDESQANRVIDRNEVKEVLEEREKISTGRDQVPTPQPTPNTSPISSPKHTRHHLIQPVTPPHSPPPDGYRFKHVEPEPQVLPEPVRQPQAAVEPALVLTNIESESETSLSVDISEELRRVAGKATETQQVFAVCHDIVTPPLSPPPVAKDDESPIFSVRQATPPATPPVVTTPPVSKASQREQTSKRIEPVSDEEEALEQPQPIMMSVGVGDDRPMTAEIQTQHRSPSPKRSLTPASTVSEESSLSTEPSSTETVNEAISEGQWLMSYSEGQVIGAVNYAAIRREIVGKGYHHINDVSTASTLRDTDDLDLDAEGGIKSEGEFMYGGVANPDKDPRLEVLALMQKKPIHVQQILNRPSPIVVMSNSCRSIGEMSIGQVLPSKEDMEQKGRYEDHMQKMRGKLAGSPFTLEKEIHERQEQQLHNRTPSPQHELTSRTLPPQQNQRNGTTTHQEQHSKTPPQQQQETLGSKSRGQMQYQPVLSNSRPVTTRGRTLPGQQGRRRNSDTGLSQSSDPGIRKSESSYRSESLSRSADGDILGQPEGGFLTSSLRSRQSGAKKSVEFDLSGTQKSSRRESRDSSDYMAELHNSNGLNYTEISLDESELRRISGGAGLNLSLYRMSVTIPSAVDGEDSELSEIDISNKSDK